MAPLLWLTDRSRYTSGTGRCPRERYLTYHAGPTGYGLVRKAEALPLMTGGYTHQALEALFTYLKEEDQLPPAEVVRHAINTANDAYEKKIAARGFRGLLQSERSDLIVQEQKALITGLVWAAMRTVLPWIHTNYRILEVETEIVYLLDCSCGLGSGVLDPGMHADRGCIGIGVQLKQDVLAQKRSGGGLAYFESKTTGWGGDNWVTQWETKPQLAIGSFGIEERYGRPVVETFILGLYKGARKIRGDGDDAIKQQDSPFCYGYKKEGNPPLQGDDWLPSYEWKNEFGETKRAPKAYRKSPIWLMDAKVGGTDWPTWLTAKQADPQITPAEWWATDFLPQSVLEKAVFLLGPMNVQERQRDRLRVQIPGEERKWQAILWELYELQQRDGLTWSDPRFQAALDRLVPASWDCRRFGQGSQCQHVGICFGHEGWETPLDSGWVPRRPHHQPELEGAIARGLLPTFSEEDEQEED